MASNFRLNGDEIEELLEVFPEDFSNNELLELEQQYVTEEQTREEETIGEEKITPQKFTVKGLAKTFTNLNKLLKKLEDMDQKVFITRKEFLWYINYLQENLWLKKGVNHHGHIS